MIPEYFKGILKDLQKAQVEFSDAEIVASNGQSILSNTLILASLSPNLKSLLKNHLTTSEKHWIAPEEKIKILIPDLDFHLLQTFFQEIIFTGKEDLELDRLAWQDVISLLGITHESEADTCLSGLINHASGQSCPICLKQFGQAKLLKRHMKTYHEENPNTCLECGKLCRSQSELQIHQRIHTKERPHTCQICQKSFTQVSHLNEHLRSQHDEDNEEICEICGLAFHSKLAVQKHMKTHQAQSDETLGPKINQGQTDESNSVRVGKSSKVKTLVCPHENCGKILKTHTSLKLHVSTQHVTDHQKRANFQCSTCQKSFTQKSHLTVHQRIHSGAKPHMCSICGKQFSVKSNMKKHLKMHEKYSDSLGSAGIASSILEDNLDYWKENVSKNRLG